MHLWISTLLTPLALIARASPDTRSLRVQLSAEGLRAADWTFAGPLGKSDVYCVCVVPGKPNAKVQTEVLENTLNPSWKQGGAILYSEGDSLSCRVFDKDAMKADDILGTAMVNSHDLANVKPGEPAVLVVPLAGAGMDTNAYLHIKFTKGDVVNLSRGDTVAYLPEAASEGAMPSRGEEAMTANVLKSLNAQPAEKTGPPPIFVTKPRHAHASKYMVCVFTGMAEAFYHKGELTQKELTCLGSSMGDSVLTMYNFVQNYAQTLDEILAHPDDVGMMLLKYAEAYRSYFHLADDLMSTCVDTATVSAMGWAGQHLKNMTYVTGQFIANGADIMTEIKLANAAFKKQDCHGFGQAMGIACRKVLLSDGSSQALPEGLPTSAQISSVTAGMARGFFGKGSKLDITSVQGASSGSQWDNLEGQPMHVSLDLHTCIEKNLPQFQFLFSKAWRFFAKGAVSLNTMQATALMNQRSTKMSIAALVDAVPAVLEGCGLTADQQASLMRAFKAGVHLQLRLPHDQSNGSDFVAGHLEKATMDWSVMNWTAFGLEIGELLQQSAAHVYPWRFAADDQGNAHGELSKTHLSEYGVEILKGVVETFLHKADLTPSEVDCLVARVGEFTYGTYEASENMALIVYDLTTNLGPSKLLYAGNDFRKVSQSVDGVVHIIQGAMETCVDGAALRAWATACKHMSDLRYLTGQFVANGVDVQQYIQDASAAFKNRSYRQFGRDMGTAARQIVLSDNPNHNLPEGVPSSKDIVNVSAGVLQGFFGKGFALDITSDNRIVTGKFENIMDDGNVPSMGKKINIHIDLHDCVKQNLPVFQSLLYGMFFFFAQETMHVRQSSLAGMGQGSFVMSAIAQLPKVLHKCGMAGGHKHMLLESFQAFGHLHAQFHLPHSNMNDTEELAVLQQAVGDWSKLRWFDLGLDLGKLIRETTIHAYPQLYTVDPAGNLQRNLEHNHLATTGSASGLIFVLLMLTIVSFAGMAIAGRRRYAGLVSKRQDISSLSLMVDTESLE